MVERVIRTLKEQCVHRHRFESLTHTGRLTWALPPQTADRAE
ncbi:MULTISPECIES: hypothetical protein [Chromobacterium]|nr:hypothetical protein [Chromobacterium amazonense]